MSNKIKFAVVGCGHIGKRHAEMIYRNKDATLTAIVDIKNKEELGIEEYQVPFFNSLEALLEADIKPDVINIATPNGLHASQAIQCLDAGTHVVIEKPFALSTTAAAAVISESQQVKKNVFVVMQNRYSPPASG